MNEPQQPQPTSGGSSTKSRKETIPDTIAQPPPSRDHLQQLIFLRPPLENDTSSSRH